MTFDDVTTTKTLPGAQGFVGDLIEAARENPASTALISMGLLWMVMGRSGGSPLGTMRDIGRTAATGLAAGGRTVGAGASSVASNVSDAVSDGLGTVAGHASDLGAAASRRVGDVASGMTSAGSSTLGSVGAMMHDVRDLASGAAGSGSKAGSQAAGSAGDLLASMRDGFTDLLQRQPLVVGAIGLAVGVGVAAALPRVAAEDAMAETVGSLKDSVREGFGNAYERAANEARVQGLTPDAASRAASDVGEKVTDVAKTTLGEAKKNIS